MGKVSVFKSMSLDGFIAGLHDEIDPLHDWLFTTRAASLEPGAWERAEGKTEKFFGPEGVNKDILMDAMAIEGATIVGRRTYDITHGWGGKPPGQGPYFVLTHTPPPKDEVSSAFTFVTEGIESALARRGRRARAGTSTSWERRSFSKRFRPASLTSSSSKSFRFCWGRESPCSTTWAASTSI
jgi:dihydrofolate reductase